MDLLNPKRPKKRTQHKAHQTKSVNCFVAATVRFIAEPSFIDKSPHLCTLQRTEIELATTDYILNFSHFHLILLACLPYLPHTTTSI